MSETQIRKDMVRRPVPFMIAWGMPISVLMSVNIADHYLTNTPIILMMAGSYLWMGVACIINAMNCSRLHCYISGPVMIVGGLLIALVGFDVINLGPVKVMHLSYATLILVALSFVPERLKGRYLKTDGPQR